MKRFLVKDSDFWTTVCDSTTGVFGRTGAGFSGKKQKQIQTTKKHSLAKLCQANLQFLRTEAHSTYMLEKVKKTHLQSFSVEALRGK